MIANKFDNIVIRALPKSASTSLVESLHYLNEQKCISCDSIYKNHKTGYDNTPNTGYIILVRHPRDQLVAEYCDALNIAFSSEDKKIPMRIKSHFCVVDAVEILKSPQHGMLELIRKEHLQKTLNWFYYWIKHMNYRKCMLLRYESMISNPLEKNLLSKLNQVCKFIDNDNYEGISNNQLWYIMNSFDTYMNKNKAKNKYPFGYSGEVGIWTKYFNNDVLSAYKQEVNRYMRTNNMSHCFNLIYPEL